VDSIKKIAAMANQGKRLKPLIYPEIVFRPTVVLGPVRVPRPVGCPAAGRMLAVVG
jgi:hypothetical protein